MFEVDEEGVEARVLGELDDLRVCYESDSECLYYINH